MGGRGASSTTGHGPNPQRGLPAQVSVPERVFPVYQKKADPASQSIKKFESSVAKSTRENAANFDERGNQVGRTVSGAHDSVVFKANFVPKNGVAIHNHPLDAKSKRGTGFSSKDLENMASATHIREMRVVTTVQLGKKTYKVTYSLSRPPGHKEVPDGIKKLAMWDHQHRIDDVVQRTHRTKGNANKDRVWEQGIQNAGKKVARRLGLTYNRYVEQI